MKDKTESQHILVIYFRVIFYLLRPSFETEGAILGTARCEPEHPLDMELLSSVRGHVLDVPDGALDSETDPPLTPEPRIKSAVSIRPRADPEFFLGGGALFSCSTSTPINHIVFFLQNTSCIRKPQVISGGVRIPGIPCRHWAHSLNKLGSIRKTELRTRKFAQSKYHNMAQ